MDDDQRTGCLLTIGFVLIFWGLFFLGVAYLV